MELPPQKHGTRHDFVTARPTTFRGNPRGNRKRDGIITPLKQSLASAKAHSSSKREYGVLPKAVSDFIQQVELGGGETIERMVVVRTPVQAYVGKLMQIVSLGKYSDVISESYYDEMFHLSLFINGRYVLEKNAAITLSDSGGPSKGITKGSEVMAVKIPPRKAGETTPPLTFTLLLERTKQYVGPKAFSNYCAKNNNCQDFILAVLESNGLAYPHLISFIKQDSESIFSKLPNYTTKMAKTLTDIGAVGDKLGEDITVKRQQTKNLLKKIGKGGKTSLSRIHDRSRQSGSPTADGKPLASENQKRAGEEE